MPRLRATVVLLSLLATGGCTPPADDPAALLADYNARIARVLDVELPPATPARPPAWPATRDLLLPVTDVRVGLRTFLEFDHCGLLHDISERNSGLGRVQVPSQRLLYEMRLLAGLRACVTRTDADLQASDERRRDFARTVRAVLADKTRDLPRNYWNATVASPELRDFLAAGARPLHGGETLSGSAPYAALASLAATGRTLATAEAPAADAFEAHYAVLAAHRQHGGRVWQGLALALHELATGSALLEAQAASARPLCPDGRPTPRARRLAGVFSTRYVDLVQPWLAAQARESRALADALEALWTAQQVPLPPPAADYRARTSADRPGALAHDFTLAVRRHALAWKSVLEPCGLAPQAAGGTAR